MAIALAGEREVYKEGARTLNQCDSRRLSYWPPSGPLAPHRVRMCARICGCECECAWAALKVLALVVVERVIERFS